MEGWKRETLFGFFLFGEVCVDCGADSALQGVVGVEAKIGLSLTDVAIPVALLHDFVFIRAMQQIFPLP